MATVEDKRWSGLKNLFIRGSLITGEEFQPDEEVRDACMYDPIVAPTINHSNTKGSYILYQSTINIFTQLLYAKGHP